MKTVITVPIITLQPYLQPGNARPLAENRPRNHSMHIDNISVLKKTIVAAIVARWSKISNDKAGSDQPNSSWAITRWPELLTGRNSVTPWRNPRTAHWRIKLSGLLAPDHVDILDDQCNIVGVVAHPFEVAQDIDKDNS